jgi:signal transduction histidine kinase
MQTKKLSSTNLLMETHAELIQLPKTFRESVCEECGWSEATFYRKAKGKNTFSNAEKDKILSVADNLLKNVWELNNKYRSRS